jgi:DNA polymerase
MADLADVEDGRLRGAFVFAGGAATGRFASYGAQLHNLGRKCAKDAPEVRSAMLRGDKLDNVSATLKSMLRPALIPEKVFTMLDWSGIEARVNPWMSTYGEDKLDLFRRGEDVYVTNAAATFRVAQVTPDQRTIGKVQELACGFAGGVGAFASMGRIYGINMAESEAQRMVDGWRRANQWAVRYWQDLEGAYTRAMRHKGHEFKAGRVTYMFDGQHLWYALPSGRVLCYPFAKMSDGEISYAKCTWKPAVTAKEWPRARLWRGLACENITQAVAADLLRHSLRQIKDVVLHCHDEILCEGDQLEEMRRIMCTPPEWCPDLPLAVDGKLMNWYTK